MSLCLNKKIEKELRALPGNNICCDCDDKNPQWASIPFGIFMCLECSGKHRSLGVHISFVRSVTMDSWSDKQISFMRIGGNNKCNDFLQKYEIQKATSIEKKYNSAAAAFYRKMISAEVEGSEVPIPPDSFEAELSDESDFVQKELKAREEARERLRQKFGHSAGLSSSGGVMQGIGSNYQPDNRDSQSFIPAVDVDKLADVSRTAFSFLSSSLTTLGDSVLKTATALIDESGNVSKPSESETSAGSDPKNESSMNVADEWANTWSSISSTAATLWKTAADATTDIVNNLQKESVSTEYPSNSSVFSSSNAEVTANDSYPEISRGDRSVGQKEQPGPSKTTGTAGSSDDFFANFGV